MAQYECLVDGCRAVGSRAATWMGTAHGSRMCPECQRRLSAAVASLPGLYRDCEDMLTGSRRSGPERVRGPLPTGVSLNPAVVAARAAMMSVTSSWAAYVADRCSITDRPRRAVPDLARFLLTHLGWLAGQDAARDAFAELTAVAQDAEEAVDSPTAGRIEVGACDHPGCDGTVYAIPRRTGIPGEVGCDLGHSWPPSEWLRLSRRLGHRTAGAAATS